VALTLSRVFATLNADLLKTGQGYQPLATRFCLSR
jgi:hypothetical protein